MAEENNESEGGEAPAVTPPAETPPADTPADKPADPPKDPPAKADDSPSLTGDKPEPTKPSLTGDVPATPQEPAETPVDIDKRLLTEDGKLNREGAVEIAKEQKEAAENYEDRIAKMRQMVSTKDDFVKDKKEYFEDFAPKERFEKYFAEETPDETKELMGKMQEKLADKYHDLALNSKQAYEVSGVILEIMEDVGLLDTRTPEQQALAQTEWIDKQKAKLGPNAENIIREAKTYVFNAAYFSGEVKNKIVDLMDSQGADFVDVVYQLKNAFGGETGGIPASVSNLQGLDDDSKLREEYKEASPERRDAIINERHAAGRTGKLFG